MYATIHPPSVDRWKFSTVRHTVGSPHQSTFENETDLIRSIDFDTRLSLDIVDIVGRFVECLRMGAIDRVTMLWIIDT